jgi:beta-glucosidase
MGVPSHANKHLLTDILRREWGFHGALVSDYFGMSELIKIHHVAATPAEAARIALDAGVDIELPFFATYDTLVEQVKQGTVSEKEIDRAADNILRAKFWTGLFDDPFVDPDAAEKITNSVEHQKLALKAAHESIILLKNENRLLPLDKAKYKKIAVIGPNAADVHLGGYSNKPGRGVSILQGVKDKVGSNVDILYAEGCKITESLPDWDADNVVLGDPALNTKRIEEAVKVAKKADLIVLALGDNEQTSREAWAPEHPGDRDSLELLGNQDDLAKAMVATGKPVVVVLLHGRPNAGELYRGECAGDSGRLVSRAGGWNGAGRRAVWGLQPGRKAADYRTAVGRTVAGLLLSEAVGQAGVSGVHYGTAFRLRLGIELHDIPVWRFATGG